MRARLVILSAAAAALLASCGGGEVADSPAASVQPASSVAASTPTSNTSPPSTTLPATSSTTTSAPDTGPAEVDIDGSCRVDVFREDENGTTWIMICTLGHGDAGIDAPTEVRSTEHSARFQYRTNDDGESVAVILQLPRLQSRNCMWTVSTPAPIDIPIEDGSVSYSGDAVGGLGCETVTWADSFHWDTESNDATMTGTLGEV